MAHTYILRCRDDTCYVGSTPDLEARRWQHNTPDQGPLHTRRRRPVVLVWSAWFDSIAQASANEKQVQGWNRTKREALIRGEFELLPDLSRRAAVQRRQGSGPSDG